MACGDTASVEEVVQMAGLSLKQEAEIGHTIRGPTNNRTSMHTMTKHGYVPIFEAKKMSIFVMHNTTITVSRVVVRKG